MSLGNQQPKVMVQHICDVRVVQMHLYFERMYLISISYWRWPVGYGQQPLYEIVVTLAIQAFDTLNVVSTARKITGFRKVELIREYDTTGESFYFKFVTQLTITSLSHFAFISYHNHTTTLLLSLWTLSCCVLLTFFVTFFDCCYLESTEFQYL
jgi:hypothetical protein